MALQQSDRRSVLTAIGGTATSLLAGCLGDESPDETDGESTDAPETDAPVVNWDNVPEFRLWLTDGVMETDRETNQRFEYADIYDEIYYAGEQAEVLDLDKDDIEGHLLRGGTTIHFGSFDPNALKERVEATDGWSVDDEYHDFAIASGDSLPIALGEDAVVIGNGYEPLIDARRGERDRLEEIDPTFTRLFEQLPDREVLVGQHNSPTGGEVNIDEIDLWGLSQETIAGGRATWVFYLETADALTEGVLDELTAIVPEVEGASIEGSEREGRVARIDAELPDSEDR